LFECYRLAGDAVNGGSRAGARTRRWLYSQFNLPDQSMPTIAIKRRHKLEPKKAKAAAQKVIKDLSARYQLACSWDGDQVEFERPGVSGHMHLRKNEVLLDVKLSFLMTPLKGPIERAINEELDRLFGDTA
jgi:putative polyhydroxyalkanoate system protein